MGNYTISHWSDVAAIIGEAVDKAGYHARLVSESDASGVILSEIVTNLNRDPIVIADVSGRNPNVMFELGMRLAFEKPAIIIIDDDTDFSFDISPVRHLKYPRSLRYAEINAFKLELTTCITATMDPAANANKKGYLQQFGPINVTKIGEHDIDVGFIAQEVQDIKALLLSSQNRAPLMREVMRSESDLLSGGVVSRVMGRNGTGLASEVKLVIDSADRDEAEIELRLMDFVRTVSHTTTGLRVVVSASNDERLASAMRMVRELGHHYRNKRRRLGE